MMSSVKPQAISPPPPPKSSPQSSLSTPKWRTTSPVPLNRENFLALLNGETPMLKIPSFISKELSQRTVEHLMPSFAPYLHATGPAVEKVGLAQFEFQAQSEEDFKNRDGREKQRYFEAAQKLSTLHDDLAAKIGENIWSKLIHLLPSLVPEWDISVASEPNPLGPGEQKYFSGIFRSINHGTPIHCDWCPYDTLTEDWILSKITQQAVFNLYLTPMRGGATTLYDLQWTPGALEFRDPKSYGYDEELVRGRQKATFRPEVGDLYLFNSRNMHEVAPVDPDWKTPRIALASFMGFLPGEVTGGRPRLMFWS